METNTTTVEPIGTTAVRRAIARGDKEWHKPCVITLHPDDRKRAEEQDLAGVMKEAGIPATIVYKDDAKPGVVDVRSDPEAEGREPAAEAGKAAPPAGEQEQRQPLPAEERVPQKSGGVAGDGPSKEQP